MNEQTKRFVMAKFEEYYRQAKVEIPKDLWMREWGFVLFDQYYPEKLVMRRHKSFASGEELVNYLRGNAPAHAYHSAAIYKYPTEKMANKGWLGADLIFDLDADHLVSEAEFQSYSYEDILKLVKGETLKLIDFLLNDFGFPEEDIELVFSGSRGYHIHIETEEVRGLGSRERREIVDYVMATGLDILVGKTAAANYGARELRTCTACNKITAKMICPICGQDTVRIEGKMGKEGGDVRLAVSEGWGKRLRTGLPDFFITEIMGKSDDEGLKKLGEMGITKAMAEKIVNMAKEEAMTKRLERMSEGKLGFLPMPVWGKIIEKERVKSADKPDAPVTADIKRLIRLPTSLHGKSSLQVKPLRIDTFEDFDPLEDAVAFGDSPVEIRVARNSSITMKGESYKVEEGEVASVPEHVALYFMCRGVAEIK
jgi:DNA primase small subunit